MTDQQIWVVIPAAGIGQRFAQNGLPKQYTALAGHTLMSWTLRPFLECSKVHGVMVALHQDDKQFSDLGIISDKLHSTIGGETRAQSVFNAMEALNDKVQENDWVLVHDAARPCFFEDDFNQLFNEFKNDEVGGIVASPISDTLKKADNGVIEQTVDRTAMFAALTPQMFRYGLLYQALKEALSHNVTVTDEAQAIERLGHRVKIHLGKKLNIKVTYPEDLQLAEFYIKAHYGV